MRGLLVAALGFRYSVYRTASNLPAHICGNRRQHRLDGLRSAAGAEILTINL